MNYFDDVNIRVLMRRFLYPGFSVGEHPFAIPVTHSIEFIRSGQIFLNRPGKTILLTAPVLFWIRQSEAFQFSVPEKQHTPCERLYCDCLGTKAERMQTWLNEVCPEGFLRPADPEKVTEIFIDAVNYYRMDREFYHAEIAECIDRIMAAELLVMTDMRIKEIVYNCKFDSMMDFSRTFKRYSGMSPRDYRRKHGNGQF